MVRVFITEDGVGDFDTGVGAMERKKSGSSTARSPRSPLASDAQAGHAGFARKMAEKVRNGISGNGGGSSSRSTSSASSGPMRFTKSEVIDEGEGTLRSISPNPFSVPPTTSEFRQYNVRLTLPACISIQYTSRLGYPPR